MGKPCHSTHGMEPLSRCRWRNFHLPPCLTQMRTPILCWYVLVCTTWPCVQLRLAWVFHGAALRPVGQALARETGSKPPSTARALSGRHGL